MKRFLSTFRALWFGASILSAPAVADSVVRIAVPDITSLLTENRDGVYQKILHRSLEGLDVAVTEQFYPYKRAMMVFEQRGADCIYSFTEVLEHRRFSAMIAAVPDVRPFLDQLSFESDKPLLESYDRLTCHNTEANRRFLRRLSAEMKQLKEAGVYEQLAGSLYVEFEAPTPASANSLVN